MTRGLNVLYFKNTLKLGLSKNQNQISGEYQNLSQKIL